MWLQLAGNAALPASRSVCQGACTTAAASPVMQCYQDAGVEVEAFEGVPLFQANHLTLRAGDRRVMTPLFLSKQDLDAALTSGLQRQDQAFRTHMQGKADQARMEINSAEKAVCGRSCNTDLAPLCCVLPPEYCLHMGCVASFAAG